MLQDYEIQRTSGPTEKMISWIELLLIVVILQAFLTLFGGSAQEEALQFRLLAHSNTAADQLVKKEVQEAIAPLLETALVKGQTTGEIGNHIAAVEDEIIELASEIANGQTITLERKEALIPPKRSGFVVQPQAMYDTYLLTIGSGRGDNWWCSLFPNVCFPNQEEQVVEEEKVTFFLWEWIKGIFS